MSVSIEVQEYSLIFTTALCLLEKLIDSSKEQFTDSIKTKSKEFFITITVNTEPLINIMVTKYEEDHYFTLHNLLINFDTEKNKPKISQSYREDFSQLLNSTEFKKILNDFMDRFNKLLPKFLMKQLVA